MHLTMRLIGTSLQWSSPDRAVAGRLRYVGVCPSRRFLDFWILGFLDSLTPGLPNRAPPLDLDDVVGRRSSTSTTATGIGWEQTAKTVKCRSAAYRA